MAKMIKTILVAGAVLSASAAQATLYNFNYTLANGSVLAGAVNGTLQADANTIVVDSVADFVTFDGVAGPSLTYVSGIAGLDDVATPAILSFDGLASDFLACDDAECSDGFSFDSLGVFSPEPSFSSGTAFGGVTEAYVPANWSLSVAGAVPDTASWALMIIGFGLVGASVRRRRAITA